MSETHLTHLDESGQAKMVDVGAKPDTERVAVAGGEVHLRLETVDLIRQGLMKKGDVLAVAQVAGVMAVEAFDSAGDPAVYPAQLAQPRKINETMLEGLQPWQPQKIYFYSDASDDKNIKGRGP